MNRYAALTPLPERVSRLAELAVDLWWSCHPDARASSGVSTTPCGVRRRTIRSRCCGGSPRARDRSGRCRPSFMRAVRRAPSRSSTRRATRRNTWWTIAFPRSPVRSIAYFSAEFAVHQSLPIYAGGLGVLAGDHCKEAGDLGVPLIGVGFMYPQGYFHQQVSSDGWQEEIYERLNWSDTAIEPAHDRRRIEAVRHGRAARRSHRARGRLARAARPRDALSARHRPRGERALGSRAVGAPLRRRPRDPGAAGDHPRHRRRPHAEGARHPARRSFT